MPPCKVVNPLAVNAATLVVPPVIVAPPPAVNNPPTLKTPASDAFPIVREPIYALAVLIVVVDKPPCKVVKLAPVTPNVPAIVVAPVIAAPPVVTVSVLEIVAVPALLKLPEVIFRPLEPAISPPTAKPLVTDSLATVRLLIYALEVLIVVVDKPPCKLVNPLIVAPLLKVANPPTCIPPVVIETAFE